MPDVSGLGRLDLFMVRAVACLAEDNHDGASGDEETADEAGGSEFFTEEKPGEEHDERDAELVERGDARGGSELEGAEVAQPGQARGQSRKGEKEQRAPVEGAEFGMFAEGEGDTPGENDDYGGANGGGEVGVHVGDADLGEKCGGGGEDGGEESPSDPGHGAMVAGSARGRPLDCELWRLAKPAGQHCGWQYGGPRISLRMIRR